MITESIDILAINETRLDDTIHDNEIRIHGYVHERNVMDTFECLLENLESQNIEDNILGGINVDVGAMHAVLLTVILVDYLKYVILFNISSLLNNQLV